MNIPESQIQAEILSSFSGERPLVTGLGENTKDLLKTHEIEINSNGLISVLGGKWTTFRAIGEDAVNYAVIYFRLTPKSASVTNSILYKSNHPLKHTSQELSDLHQVPPATAEYLIKHYGTKSEQVILLGAKPLVQNHPYIEGEIKYAIQEEFALHPADICARRLGLASTNHQLCQALVARVAALMGAELSWSDDKIQQEITSSLKEIEIYLSD